MIVGFEEFELRAKVLEFDSHDGSAATSAVKAIIANCPRQEGDLVAPAPGTL